MNYQKKSCFVHITCIDIVFHCNISQQYNFQQSLCHFSLQNAVNIREKMYNLCTFFSCSGLQDYLCYLSCSSGPKKRKIKNEENQFHGVFFGTIIILNYLCCLLQNNFLTLVLLHSPIPLLESVSPIISIIFKILL